MKTKAVIVSTDANPFVSTKLSSRNHVHNGACNVPDLGDEAMEFDSIEDADDYINEIGRADILMAVELA